MEAQLTDEELAKLDWFGDPIGVRAVAEIKALRAEAADQASPATAGGILTAQEQAVVREVENILLYAHNMTNDYEENWGTLFGIELRLEEGEWVVLSGHHDNVEDVDRTFEVRIASDGTCKGAIEV